MSRITLTLFAMLALTAAHGARGVDGVIEINQARALAGGVNGSLIDDPAGFPVTITQVGSYRLTGNLTVPDANTTAISIIASDVTLDLGGFTIGGPNTVSGSSGVCTASGTGNGITYSNESTVVRNGNVRGMGSDGVRVGFNSRVEGIIAKWNCGIGIRGTTGAVVVGSQVIENSSTGILLTDNGGLVKDSVALRNADGINVAAGSLVLGCVSTGNRGYGFFTPNLLTGVENSVFYNNALSITGGKTVGCNMLDGTVLCAPPGSS